MHFSAKPTTSPGCPVPRLYPQPSLWGPSVLPPWSFRPGGPGSPAAGPRSFMVHCWLEDTPSSDPLPPAWVLAAALSWCPTFLNRAPWFFCVFPPPFSCSQIAFSWTPRWPMTEAGHSERTFPIAGGPGTAKAGQRLPLGAFFRSYWGELTVFPEPDSAAVWSPHPEAQASRGLKQTLRMETVLVTG